MLLILIAIYYSRDQFVVPVSKIPLVSCDSSAAFKMVSRSYLNNSVQSSMVRVFFDSMEVENENELRDLKSVKEQKFDAESRFCTADASFGMIDEAISYRIFRGSNGTQNLEVFAEGPGESMSERINRDFDRVQRELNITE